jgi:1-acyl-sn-glycerol-3-phosphate acyltransferase
MISGYLGSPLRAFRRLAVYLALTITLIPVQAVAVMLKAPLQVGLPVWYHRMCCRIMGIKIVRRGSRSGARPTLYAANHVSYFDIAVLGSLINGSFIAKAEIATWPMFGWLAALQRSIFVERRSAQASAQRDEMHRRLQAGDNLILFPEGTSGDGNRILPFKSALFSVAEYQPHGRPLMVQPVSIAYALLDGMPMGRHLRPLYAWYGDMDLLGHAWQAAGLGQVTVVVEFHPPVTIAQFPSRKSLSDHCYRMVARGLSAALAGHTQGPSEPVPAKSPELITMAT